MRSLFIGTVLALSTIFAAAPAMAGENGGREKMSFPMPAATFKAKIDARQAKAREHMEKRAVTLNAEQAKALRAKFDANVAKVNAEVAKASADGTVTKEEAKDVRKVAREGREGRGGHGGHGKHGKRGDKGQPKK